MFYCAVYKLTALYCKVTEYSIKWYLVSSSSWSLQSHKYYYLYVLKPDTEGNLYQNNGIQPCSSPCKNEKMIQG